VFTICHSRVLCGYGMMSVHLSVCLSHISIVFGCRWFWLSKKLDFGSDVEAAPLPTAYSAASSDLMENSSDEEEDKDKSEDPCAKEKKKRVGFRDRKVIRTVGV